MEYLPYSLDEYVFKYPKHSKERDDVIVGLSMQMLQAVEQFHQKGYLHRDIKVANFRVNSQGKVVLTDFGLAVRYIGSDGQHTKEVSGQAFKGTLHFASIKNHQKWSISRRDDLESLGYVILYLVTSGEYGWFKYGSQQQPIPQAKQEEYVAAKLKFIRERELHPRL